MKRLLTAAAFAALAAGCAAPEPAPEEVAAPPPPAPVEPALNPRDAPPTTIATALPPLPPPASGAAAPAEPPPPAPAPLPPVLSPETIEKTFQFHQRYFSKAYKDHLPKHPGMSGTVSVDFTVNADGTVQGARLAESTLKDASFEATVVALVGRMNFPPAQGATPVSRYPVKFARSGRK